MSIDQIRAVTIEESVRAIPDPASYDSITADWTEVEYRAVDIAEDSLGGLWAGEGGSISFDAWPYTEFCVMLEGRVALTDREGNRREFTAGDAFVVPKGFAGTWSTVEPSRKYFVAMR